jgi:hypothetical protein
MSQEEEDVLSLEYFDTAEAGSSADEMDDCLSVVSEMERLAVEKDQIIHLTQGGRQPPCARQVRVLCPMGVPDLPLSPNTVIMAPAPPIVPPLHYTFSRGCL